MKYCPKCNLEFVEIDKSGQGRGRVCPFCRGELIDKAEGGQADDRQAAPLSKSALEQKVTSPGATGESPYDAALDELPTMELSARRGAEGQPQLITEKALDDQPTVDSVLRPVDEEIFSLEPPPADEDATKSLTPPPINEADFKRVTVIRERKPGQQPTSPAEVEAAPQPAAPAGGFIEKSSGAFRLALMGEQASPPRKDGGISAPTALAPARPAPSAQALCPVCSQLNPRDARKCRFCGHVVGASAEIAQFKGSDRTGAGLRQAFQQAAAFTAAQVSLGMAVFLTLAAFLAAKFDYSAGGILAPWEVATGCIAAAACLAGVMTGIRRGLRMDYLLRRSYQYGVLAASLLTLAVGVTLYYGIDFYALRIGARGAATAMVCGAALTAACYVGALRGSSWANRLTGFIGIFLGVCFFAGALAGMMRFLSLPGRHEAPILAAMAFFATGGVLLAPLRGALARRRLCRARAAAGAANHQAAETAALLSVTVLGLAAGGAFVMGGYLSVLTCGASDGRDQLMAAGLALVSAVFATIALWGGLAAWRKKGSLAKDMDILPATLFRVLAWMFGIAGLMAVIPPTSSMFFWLEGWGGTCIFIATLSVLAMLSASASRGERWAGAAMAVPLTVLLQWAVLLAGRHPAIPFVPRGEAGARWWALSVMQAGTALAGAAPPLMIAAMMVLGAWRFALKKHGMEEDLIARQRLHQLLALGVAVAGAFFALGAAGMLYPTVRTSVFILIGNAWDFISAWIAGASLPRAMPLRTPEAASVFLLALGAGLWLLQLAAARGNSIARKLSVGLWALVFGLGIWGLATWSPRLILQEIYKVNTGATARLVRFAQGADDLMLIALADTIFAPLVVLGVWVISAWRACEMPAEAEAEERAGLLGLSRMSANVKGEARVGAWIALGLIVMGAMSVQSAGAGAWFAQSVSDIFFRITGDTCAAVAAACLARPDWIWMVYCEALGLGCAAILHFAALEGDKPALAWVCTAWTCALGFSLWRLSEAAGVLLEPGAARVAFAFVLALTVAFAYGIICAWRSLAAYRAAWRLRWAEAPANRAILSPVANAKAALIVGLAVALTLLAACIAMALTLNPATRPLPERFLDSASAAWNAALDAAAMILASRPLSLLSAPAVAAIGVVMLLIHFGAYRDSRRASLAACAVWTLAALPAGFALGYLLARRSASLALALGPIPCAAAALLMMAFFAAGAVSFLRRSRAAASAGKTR